MRTLPTLLSLLLIVLVALPGARADDEKPRDPTPAELATMILDGNAAEHLLVSAWLDGADRAQLRAVFAALRTLRAKRSAPAEARLEPIPLREEPAEADAWADHKGPLVNAEVRILEFPVDAAEGLLGAHRPTADRSHHLLDDAAVGALMRAVEKHETAGVLTAPRITVYDRQKANVSVLNQVSYVQDYDLEHHGNDVFVADPIIGIVQEGILIDFTPTCSEDGRTIRLAFEGTFSSLQRPIPEKEIEVQGGRKKPKGEVPTVTIQLPQVEIGRIRESVDVASGGWVLMGGGVTFQKTKDGPRLERVALMHVQRIQPKDGSVRRTK